MNNLAALPCYKLTADKELKVVEIKRNNNNNNNNKNSASSPVALTIYKIIVQKNR